MQLGAGRLVGLVLRGSRVLCLGCLVRVQVVLLGLVRFVLLGLGMVRLRRYLGSR